MRILLALQTLRLHAPLRFHDRAAGRARTRNRPRRGQALAPGRVDSRSVAKLGLDVPGLRMREGVETHRRVERDLASALRNYLAYLWFLEPGLARAKKPRERSSGNVPPSLRAASAAAAENALSLRFLESKVGELERALPLSDSYRQLVVEENPDAVVVSPLLERGVPQIGYLRAARELGIPTGLCVASWDNLTNKGPLFGPIDLVTVWNDSQKREAVELHRVPPERVAVTGAPLYDKWFGLSPAMSRETFCRHVGLPSDDPYLLYVCSSGFIAPNEEEWILRWIRRVRASAELADVPILVRPHPQKELSTELRARQASRSHSGSRHPSAGWSAGRDRGRPCRLLRRDVSLGRCYRREHERDDRRRVYGTRYLHLARTPLPADTGRDAPLRTPPAGRRRPRSCDEKRRRPRSTPSRARCAATTPRRRLRGRRSSSPTSFAPRDSTNRRLPASPTHWSRSHPGRAVRPIPTRILHANGSIHSPPTSSRSSTSARGAPSRAPRRSSAATVGGQRRSHLLDRPRTGASARERVSRSGPEASRSA